MLWSVFSLFVCVVRPAFVVVGPEFEQFPPSQFVVIVSAVRVSQQVERVGSTDIQIPIQFDHRADAVIAEVTQANGMPVPISTGTRVITNRSMFGPVPRDISLRHVATRCYNAGLVQSEYEVGAALRTRARKKGTLASRTKTPAGLKQQSN